MGVDYNCRLPLPASPVVDPQTGVATTALWHWMLAMFTRGGGNNAEVPQALNEYAVSQTMPGEPIPLGASPFVFTAPSRGSILCSGGGVIRLEITANSTTYYSTGSWYGAVPLSKGSSARLTYIGTPVLTFIPG